MVGDFFGFLWVEVCFFCFEGCFGVDVGVVLVV